jgi:hypothetical protein
MKKNSSRSSIVHTQSCSGEDNEPLVSNSHEILISEQSSVDVKNQNDNEVNGEKKIDKKNIFSKKQAIFNTVLFGLSFAFIFLASDTALHYMTSFFEENAAYFLSVYGFAIAFSGLIAPHFQRLVSVKISLHCSSFLCLGFILLTYISLLMCLIFFFFLILIYTYFLLIINQNN